MFFSTTKKKDKTEDFYKVSVLHQSKGEPIHSDLLKMILKLQSRFLNFTPVLRQLVIVVTHNNNLTQKSF